jgi:hypothetical protein
MRLTAIIKFLPLLPLILVLGFGVRVGKRLLKTPPASMVVMENASMPNSPVSADEITRAQADARLLTQNAENLAARAKIGKEKPNLRFPSLSEMVENQTKAGLLSPFDAECLLSNNTSRDAVIRLRVGYIYIDKSGIVFPVVTNDTIDKAIGDTNNPADMALYLLGLRDANDPALGSGAGDDAVKKVAADQILGKSIVK